MTINVMLDLETMGTQANAAIIAIGAVAFDAETFVITDQFYARIDLASAVSYGGQIEASTVLWWLEQSEAARMEILATPRPYLAPVLYDFTGWFRGLALIQEKIPVWGNGADFDNVILQSAYQRMEAAAPWGTFMNRCFRTLRKMHPAIEAPAREGTHHHALDDAMHQTHHAMRIMAHIKAMQEDAEQ